MRSECILVPLPPPVLDIEAPVEATGRPSVEICTEDIRSSSAFQVAGTPGSSSRSGTPLADGIGISIILSLLSQNRDDIPGSGSSVTPLDNNTAREPAVLEVLWISEAHGTRFKINLFQVSLHPPDQITADAAPLSINPYKHFICHLPLPSMHAGM